MQIDLTILIEYDAIAKLNAWNHCISFWYRAGISNISLV